MIYIPLPEIFLVLFCIQFLQQIFDLLLIFQLLVDAFGAFLAEDNPQGQNDQLDIQQQGVIFDIHQIQAQLQFPAKP